MRLCVSASAEALTLDEILEALKELRASNASIVSTPLTSERDADQEILTSAPHENSEEEPFLVFFLRDFDEMSGKDAEILVQWVHKVTSLGLAHVVMPTHTGITSTKIENLQTLHGAENGDFVAIVLRVSKGVTDTTSAEEKLLELEVPNCIRWIRRA